MNEPNVWSMQTHFTWLCLRGQVANFTDIIKNLAQNFFTLVIMSSSHALGTANQTDVFSTQTYYREARIYSELK